MDDHSSLSDFHPFGSTIWHGCKLTSTMNQFGRRSMFSKSVVPNSYLNGYTCSKAVENVSTWSHRPTCSFAIYHQLYNIYIYTIIWSYNKLYAYINHGYQIHFIFFGFVQRCCCFAIIAPWQDCFTFLPSYRVSNSKSNSRKGDGWLPSQIYLNIITRP